MNLHRKKHRIPVWVKAENDLLGYYFRIFLNTFFLPSIW